MIEKAHRLRQFMAKIANMQDLSREIRQSARYAFANPVEQWTRATVNLAEIEKVLLQRRNTRSGELFSQMWQDLVHTCFMGGQMQLAENLMSSSELELRQSMVAFLAQHNNLPEDMTSTMQQSLAKRHYGTQLLDLYRMARTFFEAKEYAIAQDLLRMNQAYHPNPFDGYATELQGLVAFELGDFRAAALYLKDALRLDRENADSYY